MFAEGNFSGIRSQAEAVGIWMKGRIEDCRGQERNNPCEDIPAGHQETPTEIQKQREKRGQGGFMNGVSLRACHS